MSFPLLISEFADRAKEVADNPNNYYAKVEILALMKQVKQIADQGDPRAQFQLAQLYPKNSPSYLSLMQASAAKGFTNAKLALSRDYAETGKKSGLQKAARYIVEILDSGDSFIISEAKALMERNRLLTTEVQRAMTTGVGKSLFGLFAQDAKSPAEQPDVQNSVAPAT